MALTSCWRCARLPIRALVQSHRPTVRPTIPTTPPTPLLLRQPQQQQQPFSTTPSNAALVKKKTTLPMSNPKAKGSTTLKIKRKAPVKVSKPGEAGARRAERKKLVLANANALEVQLPTLTAPLAKEDRADGAVFSFDGPMIDTLKTLEGFQLKQGWEFFHRPSTLVRGESLELGKLLAWINGEVVRPKGVGEPEKVVEQDVGEQAPEQAVGQDGGEKAAEQATEQVEPVTEQVEKVTEQAEKVTEQVEQVTEQVEKVTEQAEKVTEQVTEQQADVEDWIPTGGYITTPAEIPLVEVKDKRLAKLASESRSGRRVITGTRGSGKSVLLTQAMAWAHQRNWVVLTIPNAQDLVIGHTEYEHDLATNLWLQKPYTMALLQRFLKANAAVLKATPLSQDHIFGRDIIPQTDTLYKLAELGALDVVLSWDVLNAVLFELSLPGRPPVLFTLDNLNYISLPSAYRDPDFKPIHAHDLALPNLFLSYLRGERTFWRGFTLASTTARAPTAPALAFALAGEDAPPYKKLDPRIAPSIKGAPVMAISRLTKPQAKALMEYYRDGGLYTQDVESTLAEKLVLSSGVPKELMRACLRLKY